MPVSVSVLGFVLLLLTCGHGNTVTDPASVPESSFPSPVEIASGINVSQIMLSANVTCYITILYACMHAAVTFLIDIEFFCYKVLDPA